MDRRESLKKLIDDYFSGSQAKFARAIKKSPAQVHQWLVGNRTLGDAGCRTIELTLKLPQGFFDMSRRDQIAELAERFPDSGNGIPIDASNFAQGPDIRGCTPLISWVKAGDWCEIVNHFEPGDAEEWLPCPVQGSESMFALRVRGESMFNPRGRPSFYDGDIIFVDPEAPYSHGSLVIAKLDDNEATFKKLIIEGEKRYLRAINPDWPSPIMEINGNCHICGVVIAKMERF